MNYTLHIKQDQLFVHHPAHCFTWQAPHRPVSAGSRRYTRSARENLGGEPGLPLDGCSLTEGCPGLLEGRPGLHTNLPANSLGHAELDVS